VRTKGSCWSVWTIYDLRELPGISTTGPGVDGVLQKVDGAAHSRFGAYRGQWGGAPPRRGWLHVGRWERDNNRSERVRRTPEVDGAGHN
jgi:hypothetical protein